MVVVADVRELAAELGREGIRTQPSLEPGELERGVPFTEAGGQEEELGLWKDSECNFRELSGVRQSRAST